jgi:hypothetical protein
MRVDYEYVAILEFDDETGLRAYLDHGAHEALATRFFECIEEMLFYDFDVDEGERSVDRFA